MKLGRTSEEGSLRLKDNMYGNILQHIDTEDYLTEGRSNLNEGNLSALTLDIVHRIRSKFCRKVGCTIAKGNIACFRG